MNDEWFDRLERELNNSSDNGQDPEQTPNEETKRLAIGFNDAQTADDFMMKYGGYLEGNDNSLLDKLIMGYNKSRTVIIKKPENTKEFFELAGRIFLIYDRHAAIVDFVTYTK